MQRLHDRGNGRAAGTDRYASRKPTSSSACAVAFLSAIKAEGGIRSAQQSLKIQQYLHRQTSDMALKAAILFALVALTAFTGLTAARSVPAAVDDDATQVVFVIDADSEAVSEDAGDFDVEEDSEMTFEDTRRDKRRKNTRLHVITQYLLTI